MGAVRVDIASRFAKSFVRSVQQVEDDDAFCRLIYRLTELAQDDTEISIGQNTDNERHDETSEREEL